MFQRVTDIFPRHFSDELIRLAGLDREWVQVVPGPPPSFQTRPRQKTWLTSSRFTLTGADLCGLWATSIWLVDGPKVFRPTLMQCKALEHVDVRLQFDDYEQPYQAIMIELPPDGNYDPFTDVICFKSENLLVFNLRSRKNLDDITTTIARYDGRGTLEESFKRYDESCAELQGPAARALRVSANSCLALVGHETATGYLFPQEVERDKKLAAEHTERGERARDRLPLHAMLVAFKRDVRLYKTQGGHSGGDPTGRELDCHWCRGHHAMQPYGPGSSLRKKIFRPPIMIREDKFLGEMSDTTTIMRT